MGTLPGLTALYLVVRAYSNYLSAEISQICYGGIARTICLGTTDGLSTTWSGFFISYQPVVVPVGAITLGRILSVVGSVLDPYIEIFSSCTFCDDMVASSETADSSSSGTGGSAGKNSKVQKGGLTFTEI